MKTLKVEIPKVDIYCQLCGYPMAIDKEDKQQIVLGETYQFNCLQCKENSEVKIDLESSKLIFINP